MHQRRVGAQLVAGIESLLRMAQQRVDGQTMPMRALHREPVFEPGRARDLEAVEEVAVDEGRALGPVASFHEPLELIGIELHCAIRQLDYIPRCRELIFADVVSQDTDGFAHRLSRGGVVFLCPEQPDQLLAGGATFGCARQVEQ